MAAKHVQRFRERQVPAALWQFHNKARIDRHLARQSPDFPEPTTPFIPECYVRAAREESMPDRLGVCMVLAGIAFAVMLILACVFLLLTDPLASANEVIS